MWNDSSRLSEQAESQRDSVRMARPSLQDGSAHTLQSVSGNLGDSRTHSGARAVPARRRSTIKAARVRSLLLRQKAASASRDGSRSVSFCKTSYVGQNVPNYRGGRLPSAGGAFQLAS